MDSPRAGARDTSGTTLGLILDYVERNGGRQAVRDTLARAGVAGRETELRDEDAWFPFSLKIALFRAASDVLGDPLAPRRIGATAIDSGVAVGLKLALRALGSPRMVYANVARASGKFSLTHRMELVDLGQTHARMAFRDLEGRRYEPEDCLYNTGLLSCVPALFGLPTATVDHPACARDGADACVFDVRWRERAISRGWTAATALSGAAVAASAIALPALLPAAGAAAGVAAGAAVLAGIRGTRRQVHLLEAQLHQQAEAHERLSASLSDLASGLRLEEVLAKIVANARAGATGKEFALFVDEGDGMRCLGSTGLPDDVVAELERWAAGAHPAGPAPRVIDDVLTVPGLAALAANPEHALGSLCAAPLTLRGTARGMLVALASGSEIFLPHDIEWLGAYAAQAAIALRNASVYQAQEQLASRDPLTGLLNHREFHERVTSELKRSHRHGGEFAVVLFDLDGFKLVNDQAGHAEGDRVLRAVADTLLSACRTTDSAFRIGGDEFALVLPETGGEAATEVADRASLAAAAADARTTVSYGIASWPEAGPDRDALLERADASLYASKRALRGTNGDVTEPADARKRLGAASRLAERLAPLADEQEIAATAVRELHTTFGHFFVVILRLNGDVLNPLAGAGPLTREMSHFEAWTQTVDEGVIGRVVRTGEPALVPDTARDPDFLRTNARRVSGSELAVPIRVAGEIWGALNVEELEQNAFGLGDLLFADGVAGQVGAALHRARVAVQAADGAPVRSSP